MSGSYLKKHTEALIKDLGFKRACEVTGKSKATLGRYFSPAVDHADRFAPIDAIAAMESVSSYPHVTAALAEVNGFSITYTDDRRENSGQQALNADVIALSQRFAMLMAEYSEAIADGKITINEAKRMLSETLELQKVLVDMKLHLESDVSPGAA
jgi:hypothetical protein